VKYAQAMTSPKTRELFDDFVFWSTILRTAAAYQVFHRLEARGADLERVSRFLIFNPSHPRSIGFCVREIGESLHILRHSFRLARANKCLEECEVMMEGLHQMGRHIALAEHLHDFNNWVQTSLGGLTDTLSAAFFTRSRPEGSPADRTRSQTQTQSQTGEPSPGLQEQNQNES